MNDPSKHLLIAPFFSCLLLGIQGVDATTPSAEGVAFFEKKIRPALIKYCYECHSEESGKTRGGLLLDTREGMLQGGDNGNVLAGDPLHKIAVLGGNQLGRYGYGNAAQEANARRSHPIISVLASNGGSGSAESAEDRVGIKGGP